MRSVIAAVLIGISGVAVAAQSSVASVPVHKAGSRCTKAQLGQVARAPDGSLVACASGEFKRAPGTAKMAIAIADKSGTIIHSYAVSGFLSKEACEADVPRSSAAITAAYGSDVTVQARCMDAGAANSVAIPVLGGLVSIADDGHYTYVDVGTTAAVIFARRGGKEELANFVVLPDGSWRFNGVITRGAVAYPGGRVAFDRR